MFKVDKYEEIFKENNELKNKLAEVFSKEITEVNTKSMGKF